MGFNLLNTFNPAISVVTYGKDVNGQQFCDLNCGLTFER